MRRTLTAVGLALGIAAALFAATTEAQQMSAGPNVNMVKGTENDPFLQRQAEPALDLSTRNACHMLAGAVDYRTVDMRDPIDIDPPDPLKAAAPPDSWLGVYKSFDCGANWTSDLIDGYPQSHNTKSPLFGYSAAADPIVRAGANGMFFYGGMVFNREGKNRSAIFINRFIDNNDRDRGDTFTDLGAKIIAVSEGEDFLDKPWMAVDVPRVSYGERAARWVKTAGNEHFNGDRDADNDWDDNRPGPPRMCEVNGQRFPAGRIFMAWTTFKKNAAGIDPTPAKLKAARSDDCGETWKIKTISQHVRTSQGATIAIAPHTGTAYIAWREFPRAGELPAIWFVRSTDGGHSWSQPLRIATFHPFDQPRSADPVRFRTNTIPTIAADDRGNVYVAWAARGYAVASGRGDTVVGDSRIVLAVSSDGGRTFAKPYAVDDPKTPGHQVMPSLMYRAGKLLAVFYDFREDPVPSGQFIDGINHRAQVWAAEAAPGKRPTFRSFKVSQFRQTVQNGVPVDIQANMSNVPIYQIGTVGFLGDYVDSGGLSSYPVQFNGNQYWVPNAGPLTAPTTLTNLAGKFAPKLNLNPSLGGFAPLPFAVTAATDNRDVIPPPPPDFDWTKYYPPNSPEAAACDPNGARTGMRNANIYMSRLSPGAVVGTLGNTRPLGTVLLGTPPVATHIQRGFVIFIQNTTKENKFFRLNVANQPGNRFGDRATFFQLPAPPYSRQTPPPAPTLRETQIDVQVTPLSTFSRTVYVTANDRFAQVRIDVQELTASAGDPNDVNYPFDKLALKPGGLKTSVLLNPDKTNPEIKNPEVPSQAPPSILQEEVSDPVIFAPILTTLSEPIPGEEISNPVGTTTKREENPREGNPREGTPREGTPREGTPRESNAGLENTSIADVSQYVVLDYSFKTSNNSNKVAKYAFSPVVAQGQFPAGTQYQVLITKRNYLPTADGKDCSLVLQYQNQVQVNMSNFMPREGTPREGTPREGTPREGTAGEQTPREGTPREGTPREGTPREGTASFLAAPGETYTATLRVFVPNGTPIARAVREDWKGPEPLRTSMPIDMVDFLLEPKLKRAPAASVASADADAAMAPPPNGSTRLATAPPIALGATRTLYSGAVGGVQDVDIEPPIPTNVGAKLSAASIDTTAAAQGETLPESDSATGDLITSFPPPDASPATVAPGGGFIFNWTLANKGKADVNPAGSPAVSFTNRFVLSLSPTLMASDLVAPIPSCTAQPPQPGRACQLAFETTSARVPAEGSLPRAAQVLTIPRTTPAGVFYAIVIADADNTIFEDSDANNASEGVAAVPITVAFALAFAPQPTNATQNFAFSPVVKIAVVDGAGVAVPSSDAPQVTMAIGVNPAGGTLAGTTTRPNVNGVATFDDLRINNPGTGYRLLAAVPGSPGLLSAPFNIVSQLPPNASSQTITTLEETPINGTLAATDPESDPITFSIETNGSKGSASITNAATGAFTYTPLGDANGTDTFTFIANDGTVNSAIATVTVNITPVNDRPVAAAQSLSTSEDTTLAVTLGGSDVETAPANLSFMVTGGPTHGTLSGTPPNLTYTSHENYNGPDSFTFTVTDRGDPDNCAPGPLATTCSAALVSLAATVSITVQPVNDAPSFTKGANQSPEAGGAQTVPFWATNVTAGPADEAGQTVDFIVTNDQNALFSVQPAISPDGTLTYTPAPGAAGTVLVTVRLHDSGGVLNGGVDTSAPQTFTITLIANQPPIARDDYYSTAEDTPLTAQAICLPTMMFPGFADTGNLTLVSSAFTTSTADGTVLRLVPAATHQAGSVFTPLTDIKRFHTRFSFRMTNRGSTNANPPNGWDGTLAGADGLVFVMQRGGPTALGGVGGSIGYQGIPNSVGVEFDTFRNDEHGDTSSNHIGIDVNGSVESVQTKTIANDLDNGNVWTAWIDYDGAVLEVRLSEDGIRPELPTMAHAIDIVSTIGGDVAYVGFTGATGLDFEDIDVLNWTYSTCEPGVLTNDSDPNEGPLTAEVYSGPSNGELVLNPDGSFIYTPNPDFNGSDSFTYTASTGSGSSSVATVTISVLPVNDAPVASDDTYSTVEDALLEIVLPEQLVLQNDFDREGSALGAILVSGPSHGTLQFNVDETQGAFRYTPNATYNGPDSFTYKVSDGELTSNTATIFITVYPVNDAPSFTKGPDQTSVDNAGFKFVNGWATAISSGPPDESGQLLTFLVTNDHNTLFSTQPAVSPFGRLTYTPAFGASGVATVTVRLRDSGGTDNGGVDTSAAQTFTITINRGPRAGEVVISELRVRGPGGDETSLPEADEFVEIYNNTDTDFVVATGDGSAGWSVVDSTNYVLMTIPNGTVLRARGHYLGTSHRNTVFFNPGGVVAAAGPDATWGSADNHDIPDGGGVAIFRTANPELFNTTNRLDAAGFNTASTVFREGAGFFSIGSVTTEHSLVRRSVGFIAQDTNNNSSDFVLVSPTDVLIGGFQPVLGAPGPESTSSPVRGTDTGRSGIVVTPFDAGVGATAEPNQVRIGNTLILRRRVHNGTGVPITRLRFRIVDIATLGIRAVTEAELHAISSATEVVTSSNGPETVLGTTLDRAFDQPNGGGLNSALSVTLPGGVLDAGSQVNVQFGFTVAAEGEYRINTDVAIGPAIAPVALFDAVVGQSYNAAFVSVGTFGSQTWSLVTGASQFVALGLTFNANGTITGTPTGVGRIVFTARVTENGRSADRGFTLNVIGPPPEIPAVQNEAVLFENYVGLTSFGARGTVSWRLDSPIADVPPGLAYNASTGLTGIPTKTGNYPLTYTLSDCQNNSCAAPAVPDSVTRTITLHVASQEQQAFAGPTTNQLPAVWFGGATGPRLAQTFTVGVNGLLDAVRFNQLSCPRGTELIVDILPVTAGPPFRPYGAPLANGTWITNLLPGLATVRVTPALQVSANQRLAIAVRSDAPCSMLRVTTVDNYGGGDAFLTGSDYVPLRELTGGFEVAFRTMTQQDGVHYAQAADGSVLASLGWHTATRLLNQNGDAEGDEVLLVGGNGAAVVFNTNTKQFTATGPMGARRQNHTAVRLTCPSALPGCAWKGKVLVVGGRDTTVSPWVYHATAELFDPVNKTFVSVSGSMAAPRASHTATPLVCPDSNPCLYDAKVLIAGGESQQSPQTVPAQAELFDPSAGTFAQAGAMAGKRWHHTATRLPNGKIVFIGGYQQSGFIAVETYHPDTSTFTRESVALRFLRARHTATWLSGRNRILIVGGDWSFQSLTSAELYDPFDGVMTDAGNLAEPRADHAAVALADGTVLVTGGNIASLCCPTPPPLASVETYHGGTTWRGGGSMVVSRSNPTVVFLHDQLALLSFGGGTSALAFQTVEYYDGSAALGLSVAALPDGQRGQPYDQTLTGFGAASFQFHHVSGELPGGLTFDDGTGRIHGTVDAMAVGAYAIGVRIVDSDMPTRTTVQTVIIRINRLIITTTSLPTAYVGTMYHGPLAASGVPPLTWNVFRDSLPDGLSISGNEITGTPTSVGFSSFYVQVVDNAGQTAIRQLFISVQQPLTITTTSLGAATAGQGYGFCMGRSGGNGPVTWVIAPDSDKPSGLPDAWLKPDGCFDVSLKVMEAGTFTLNIRASDAQGQVATRTLTLHVGVHGAGGCCADTPAAALTFSGSSELAQTIQNEVAGQLIAIDLPVYCSNGDLTIEIRNVLSTIPNAPGTSVRWSQIVPGSMIPPYTGGFAFYRRINFSMPALLQLPVGARFAVVLRAANGGQCGIVPIQPVVDDWNMYPHGEGFSGNGVSFTRLAVADSTRPDLPFNTLVNPGRHALSILNAYRGNHTATALTDGDGEPTGQVLLAGGASFGATAEVYDAGTRRFSATADEMETRRWGHTATPLPDGRVLITGGADFQDWPNQAVLGSVEIYNRDGTFVTVGQLATPRVNHTATLLDGFRVLLTGGYGDFRQGPLANAEIFDAATGTTSALIPMMSPRAYHTATKLASGKVLVTGGWGGDPSRAEVYTPVVGGIGSFANTGSMGARRAVHTATLLTAVGPNQNKVLIVGGQHQPDTALAELYDEDSGTFSVPSTQPFLQHPRAGHVAVPIPNGKVAIIGGYGEYSGPGDAAIAEIEVYDSATDRFSAGGTTIIARDPHTATPLPDGTVLVAAGNGRAGATGTTAEIFDPSVAARLALSETTLPDGSLGNAYAVTLHATGTNPPFNFMMAGLPAGLSQGGDFGEQIVGTPQVAGTAAVVVTVTDNALPANSISHVLPLAIDRFTIATSTLPNAVVGQPYSAQLTALNAVGAVKWTVEFGPFPGPGLTLDESGHISGSPTTQGGWGFTVKAVDSAGQIAVKSLSIFVTSPLQITTTTLADAVAPWSYGWCLGWHGGSGSPTWKVTKGALPYDLSLGETNGCFSGPVLQTGTFGFDVTAETGAEKVTRSLTLRAGTVDQAQFSIDPATTYATFGGATEIAQVFTPAMDGYLIDIQMPVYCASVPMHLEIRGVTDGVPNSNVLAMQDFTAAYLSAFSEFGPFHRQLRLETPLFLAKGSAVAAVLSSSGSCYVAQMPPWAPLNDTRYQYGDGFTGTTGAWTPLSASDPARPDLSFHAVMDDGGRLLFEEYGRSETVGVPLINGPNSGSILFVAGGGGNVSTLFNPLTQRFGLESFGVERRRRHTATRLPDGRVLVVGGIDDQQQTAVGRVEIYNPASNSWSLVGALATARFNHMAALLPADGDGRPRVLIAGGQTAWNTPALSSTEIFVYDGGGAGHFIAGPAMNDARTEAIAVTLAGQKVLIVGGWGSASGIELYTPDTGIGAFSRDGALLLPRAGHAAVLLGCPPDTTCSYNGKVLVLGGWSTTGPGMVLDAELYDPAAQRSTKVGRMLTGRTRFAAVRLTTTGEVVVAGGDRQDGQSLSSIEMYDPTTELFSPAGDLTVPRGGIAAVRTAGDTILFVGGYGASAASWGSAELMRRSADVLDQGMVNASYNETIPFTGTGTLTFMLKSGMLPDGVQLNLFTGALTGAPTVAGTYRFVIEIIDSASPHRRLLRHITLYVSSPMELQATILPDAVTDVPYSERLIATGGLGGRTWSVVGGELPPGMTLGIDGLVSGTPNDVGPFTFRVKAEDGSGNSVQRDVTIAVHTQWRTTFPEGGVISPGAFVDPPAVAYAALQRRGLFTTSDGGASWISLTDHLSNTFPFDPRNIWVFAIGPSQIFYAVSGGRPFKSVNGGGSWTEIANGLPSYPAYVQALAVHPTSGHLFAGTSGAGVFKSVDGGASWSAASQGMPGDARIQCISLDPTQAASVYAGTWSDGLFRSLDGGATWVPSNSGSPLIQVEAITVNAASPSIVYAVGRDRQGIARVVRTSDGGGSWASLDSNVSLYGLPGPAVAAVDPTSDTLYVASYGYLVKHVAGRTGDRTGFVADAQLTAVIRDESTGTFFVGTNGLGVFTSTNGGATWVAVNNGLRGISSPFGAARSLHLDVNNPQMIYSGSINRGYRSTDGGATWGSLNHPDFQASTLLTHPAQPGTVYSFRNRLWRSTDSGLTWSAVTPQSMCCWYDGDLVLSPSDPGTMFMAVVGSMPMADGIYKSTDGGGTWVLVRSGQFQTLAIDPNNGNVLFAGAQATGAAGGGSIYRTVDGGATWTQVGAGSGLPAGLWPTQILFPPYSSSVLYVSSTGGGTIGGVYKSSDGGDHWTKLLQEDVTAIAVDLYNLDILYAGTWGTNGLYRTSDGGVKWMPFTVGLPVQPAVESIAMDPINYGRVSIGTSAGVYEATFAYPPGGDEGAIAIANPSAVAFGVQAVGTVRALKVEIAFTASGPLAVSGGQFVGPDAPEFQLDLDTCARDLSESRSCFVQVSFAPSDESEKSATLELAVRPGPSPLRVRLSGSGLSADHRIIGRVINAFDLQPMPNKTVKIYNASGSQVVATATTDVNGTYFTPELPDGSYRARADVPGTRNDLFMGMTCGAPCDISAGTAINLPMIGAVTSVDFTLSKITSIEGVVTGIDVGALAGVTLQLFDNQTGALVAQTMTDVLGHYAFADLNEGLYYARTFNAVGYADQYSSTVLSAAPSAVANFTLDVNTPLPFFPGAQVHVAPLLADGGQPMSLAFWNVTAAGKTTIAVSSEGGALPLTFNAADRRYAVGTTATFTGVVQACVTYSAIAFANPAKTRLVHGRDGAWTDVTSQHYPQSSQVCGFVDALGLFTAAELSGNTLTPQPCSFESSFRSNFFGQPLRNLTFTNLRTETIYVYWLDYFGSRVLYSTVSPGASYTQGTYEGHPWLITNQSGQCFGIYVTPSFEANAVVQ